MIPSCKALVATVSFACLAGGAGDEDFGLEFVVIDGERQLSLGRFTDIRVRAGKKTSVSQTFSLNAYDFESFFAVGKAPTLRVTRATRAL